MCEVEITCGVVEPQVKESEGFLSASASGCPALAY